MNVTTITSNPINKLIILEITNFYRLLQQQQQQKSGIYKNEEISIYKRFHYFRQHKPYSIWNEVSDICDKL